LATCTPCADAGANPTLSLLSDIVLIEAAITVIIPTIASRIVGGHLPLFTAVLHHPLDTEGTTLRQTFSLAALGLQRAVVLIEAAITIIIYTITTGVVWSRISSDTAVLLSAIDAAQQACRGASTNAALSLLWEVILIRHSITVIVNTVAAGVIERRSPWRASVLLLAVDTDGLS